MSLPRAIVLVAGALVALNTTAPAQQDARAGAEITESLTRTIRIGPNGTLDLSNEAGDVSITGGNGADVTIEAVKRVRPANRQDPRTLLQEIVIGISEQVNRVEVRTTVPLQRNGSGGVDYTVTLPHTANVTVRTVTGDLRITNVGGELRASSVSGDIIASSVGQVRALRTLSGDIEISEAAGEDVTISTANGDVVARHFKSPSVDVGVDTGNVRFTDAECGAVYLRATTGNVEYAGRLAPGGRYQLQSHSGDIRFTPVGDTGFDLEANSYSGNVRSDYAFPNSPTHDTSGTGGLNRTLRGTVGDASALIELRSYSGNIVIAKRE